MVNEGRQAGDSTTDSGECFQKALEATERLRSDLAQIKSVGMTG